MVDSTATHKKLVGNVALHLGLFPERRFLRRNLRHVLDIHEHLLQRLAISDGTASTAEQDMIANERRRSGWDYPTKEMLNDLMKGQKPFLRIEALQIRHLQSKADIERGANRRNGERHAEDWLPPSEAYFNMPCTVSIGVADPAAPKQRIFVESRPATILQYKDEPGVSRFDVELDHPFLIEVSKLFTVEATGNNPFRWRRTVTAKYVLDVNIHCRDSEDTAELLSCLEGKDASSYSKTSPVDGVLNATWENLPECPSDADLLILKRSKGHKGNKALEPEYKLEIAMGWTRRKDTPLEQYNKSRTRFSRAARQLPTPTASEDLDKRVEACEVVYKYQEGLFTRMRTVNGLHCPLCPNSTEQPSMERLRLHCATFHDHFKFEPEDTAGPGQRPVKTRHVVWISLAEKEIEREKDKLDAEKINWIAPDRPFDVSAHLRGQDDWTGMRVRKSKGGRGRPAGTARAKDSASSGPIRDVRKRPALDEIEDLPEQSPRKRRAPNVPSVRFYHLLSKLAIQPGSLIEDGAENADEAWLQEKDRYGLDKYEVAGTKKEFIIAYNKYMEREQTDSTMFMREALVRFARRYHAQLQDREWRQHFREKLKLLSDYKVVTEETVEYCCRLVGVVLDGMEMDGPDDVASDVDRGTTNGPPKHVNGDIPNRPRKQWLHGKFVIRDTPQAPDTIRENGLQHNITIALPSKTPGLCKCGKSASGERGALFCANPNCVRKDYHLACVGLEKRIPGWRCADCSP